MIRSRCRLLWFPREPGRVTLEETLERWPRLVAGLVARPSIGVVVAQSEGRGAIAIGATGLQVLDDGQVEGEDPLLPYGSRARADLLRATSMANTGDLLILSSVDATGHVHAFEELVGSHGGMGGDQNEAMLLYPSELSLDPSLLEDRDGQGWLPGAESVHRQLVAWMRHLGIRP